MPNQATMPNEDCRFITDEMIQTGDLPSWAPDFLRNRHDNNGGDNNTPPPQPVADRTRSKPSVSLDVHYQGDHNDSRLHGIVVQPSTIITVNKNNTIMLNVASLWLHAHHHPANNEVVGRFYYEHKGQQVSWHQKPCDVGIANGDTILLILPELSDVSSSELSSDSGEGIRTHNKYGYPRRGWEHLEDDDQGSEDGDEPESTNSSSYTNNEVGKTNTAGAFTVLDLGPAIMAIVSSYLGGSSLAFFLSFITSEKEHGLFPSEDFNHFISLLESQEDATTNNYELAISHCIQQIEYLKKGYRWSLSSCTYCKKIETADEPFQFCGKCDVFKYCSRSCCVSDWPHHKKICGLYQTNWTLPVNPTLVSGMDVGKALMKWQTPELRKSLSKCCHHTHVANMPPQLNETSIINGESNDDSSVSSVDVID